MDAYKTGTTSPSIVLAVDVNTFGLAATLAKLTDPASGAMIKKFPSVNASGDIPPVHMGTAAEVNSKRLRIDTEISLAIIHDLEDRKKEFERLTATYTISGGQDGTKIYTPPDQKKASPDYTKVFLSHDIVLIK